ncbi:methionine gamma-lyase [Plectosphaerella plurivora]|uniref:Methionine gamma-lyase n=1 Tax=Plectosphaerella plurivora TaxID=936078 RepID=A0A9P8V883_9PEZI|nr:methionine gamma-lyase [Plectosphaerella plurivora]
MGDNTSSEAPAPKAPQLSLASLSVHADDHIAAHRAIAPAMHVSTTFEYTRDPDELRTWDNTDPAAPRDSHIYSRDSAPNTTRLEAILTSILHGPSLTYASGLAAFYALMVRLNPRRIAIGQAYHGCHGIVQMLTRLTGLEILALPDEGNVDSPVWAQLQAGDVIHVETPVNPTGEARDLAFYSARAKAVGAFLTVDATFAPPPLQDPFVQGADVILHSGTKYFGGHSDMLCGVLAVAPRHATGEGDANIFAKLRFERLLLGSVMGSLEGWLGIRSLRTLELRVRRQAESATNLAAWLAAEAKREGSPVAAVVESVAHASLQPEAADENSWLRKQMPGGFGPVFSIFMRDRDSARRLPSKLGLFHHATSLGGVESIIEWRRMSDKGCDERLLRVSVGVEGWEDLRDDLLQGFEALGQEKKA